MNNDIKEILEYFRHQKNFEDCVKVNILIDYITNLQEENERLKKLLDFEIERNDLKQEKIDKAIEYIKKVIEENEEWTMYREDILLNILEDDNNE